MVNRIAVVCVVIFTILLCGCKNGSEMESQGGFKWKDRSVVNFPEPRFDKTSEELLHGYEIKYHAKAVKMGRPYRYSSESDYSYWLRIEFLNPELNGKTFDEFGREVSLSIFEHLINDQDFEKIEIGVVHKKGLIITFSSKQQAFFFRDSL